MLRLWGISEIFSYKVLVGKYEGKNRLEYLDVDGTVILK